MNSPAARLADRYEGLDITGLTGVPSAEREAPRMHTPFDEAWCSALLAASAAPPSVERAQDWGEAPNTLAFVGRADELALLRRWVLDERCRLVAMLGLGGIGKTSLAAR